MSIQKLVPSKDICEQLAAAGFPQETCFYWVDAIRNYQATGERFENDEHFVLRAPYNYMKTMSEKEKFAAPTAEEIFNLLPHKIQDHYYLEIYKKQPYVMARYVTNRVDKNIALFEVQGKANSLVHVLSRVYLYLKSNNLI